MGSEWGNCASPSCPSDLQILLLEQSLKYLQPLHCGDDDDDDDSVHM